MAFSNNYMTLALNEAAKAGDRGEVPVGAVLVEGRTGQIIAQASNRVITDHDPSAHAEIVAIRAGAQARGSERLGGCDLYVTLEPCPMCAQAISFARIRRLYFAASDPKGGGVYHGPRIFNASSCHHAPDIYDGMCEQTASRLLKAFFKARR